ncbi:MAG: ATP-binding cassette domain-containing protein [Spirochaetota bacterium]|nr:ATP-binding cassette domain-containing protein [Spirochaetota bacterium]
MIQISSLNKGYSNQEILSDVSFTINEGEKLGLVGRNGHGKTTLFRMLAGLENPDSGTIQFPKGYKIAYLKQEMSFDHPNVLEEVLSVIPEGEPKEEWFAEKILFGLDFDAEMITKDPNTLSGGWMNRINLAKVLISNADMLLLDEPTNHLDIVTIHWLANFLKNWRKELILITHDRMFMDTIINHIMAIHRKQVRKIPGTSVKLYEQIATEEEVHEKTRLNDAKEKEKVELFISKFRAKARLAGMVQSRIKSLEKKDFKGKLDAITDLDFKFNLKKFDTKIMLTVDNLCFGYDPKELLIKGLDFDVSKGDKIAIVGKNGKGKSTLLRLLCDKLSPTSGNVRSHPQLLPGYYGQVAEQELNPMLTIEEEIASVLPGGNRGYARSIAGAMLFEGELSLKRCNVLSGGEKARVLLAKLIATPTHCLFLDEPSNHLDMQSVDSLTEALENFNGGMVFVTHNEMMLHALATKLIVFDGDFPYVFLGTYQEFLEDKGFSGEELAKKPKKEKTKGNLSKEEKKELQKKKQAFQNSLKPLKNEISAIEEQIQNAEDRTKDAQTELVIASEKNNGEALALLGKELNTLKIQIDTLFSSLSSKNNELEELQKNAPY